jgi:hypothetical protein
VSNRAAAHVSTARTGAWTVAALVPFYKKILLDQVAWWWPISWSRDVR